VTGKPDESELTGLDPYDIQEREAARLERFFASLPEDGWARPTRCEGWTVRDMLAHLASVEDYHRACLDDTLDAFLKRGLEAGATDLAGFNEWGIRAYDGRAPTDILAEWVEKRGEDVARMRGRDGGTMTTMVADYPVRLQAFHTATELATHADDAGVPVAPAEASARTDWRARFNRFAVAEDGRDVEILPVEGHNRVRRGDVEAELTDAELVEAVAGRLPADHPLPAELRAVLSLAA
jgi:uncharacterized protein (TIGR03083 family)